MCEVCTGTLEAALKRASVADVLKIEALPARTRQAVVRGVMALGYDDLEAEITERADQENDDAWYARWAKNYQPEIDRALFKVEAVARRIDDAALADELRQAVEIIENVASEFKP